VGKKRQRLPNSLAHTVHDSLGPLPASDVPVKPHSVSSEPKPLKILLQNCDGRFQIGVADQACRERRRRIFIVGRALRISAFGSEFAALLAQDYRK